MPLVEVGYDDPNKEEEVMSDLLKLAADTREAGSPEGTLRPCDRRSEAAVLLREPPTMRPNGMMGCKESCDFLRGYFAPGRFIQRVPNMQYLQPTTISGTTNTYKNRI